MGVYIKDLEMPKTCGKCQIKNTIECNRWKLVRSVILDRHKDCPFVPVQAHGRLIDADALHELLTAALNDPDVTSPVIRSLMKTIITAVDDAPTIIPA